MYKSQFYKRLKIISSYLKPMMPPKTVVNSYINYENLTTIMNFI